MPSDRKRNRNDEDGSVGSRRHSRPHKRYQRTRDRSNRHSRRGYRSLSRHGRDRDRGDRRRRDSRSARHSRDRLQRQNRFKRRRNESYSRSVSYKRNTRSSSYSSRSRSRSSSSIDDEIGHYNGHIGDVLNERYTIQEELGKGTFGKVFKCQDRKHNDFVAVKVVRSIDRYLDSALIEADLLNDIYEKQRELRKNCCVKMFSQFRWNDHVCMVFETLGSSLYDIIKKNEYKGLPLFMVRDISRQLLQAMSFLKSVNLIHTDLKLENVLFVHSAQRNYEVIHDGQTHTISAPEKTRIKLIDFGGATYDNDPHKSRMVNTRQYRGPEVTLEVGWSFPSDLWSVGCIIGEIYRGDLFFQTHEELEHLALIEKLCGPFPSQLLEKCSFRSKYFDRNGRVRFGELPRDSKEFVRDAKSFQEFFSLQPNDVESGIVSLVEGLLQIDPMQRFSADEALATSSFLFPASTEHSNHGSDTNNYNRNHSSATVTTTSST